MSDHIPRTSTIRRKVVMILGGAAAVGVLGAGIPFTVLKLQEAGENKTRGPMAYSVAEPFLVTPNMMVGVMATKEVQCGPQCIDEVRVGFIEPSKEQPLPGCVITPGLRNLTMAGRTKADRAFVLTFTGGRPTLDPFTAKDGEACPKYTSIVVTSGQFTVSPSGDGVDETLMNAARELVRPSKQ